MVVLFNSGATHTWINRRALPPGATPNKVERSESRTLAGTLASNLEVTLDRITLPDFFKTRTIDSVTARVFETSCRYDMIIGRDLLHELGMILNFKDKKVTWDECHVLMRSAKDYRLTDEEKWNGSKVTLADKLYVDAMEADLEDDDTLPTCDMTDCSDDLNDEYPLEDSEEGNDQAVGSDSDMECSVEEDEDDEIYGVEKKDIKESKYESADIDQVVRLCTHLSQNQQNDLREVLDKYPTLFNNVLGTYPDEKINLDVREDATPQATRAYTVPHSQLEVFKKELDRLVRIGVLEEGSRSEWISGTFIVPKKLLPGATTPRVRWISDFRALNKALRRKVYPIPRI